MEQKEAEKMDFITFIAHAADADNYPDLLKGFVECPGPKELGAFFEEHGYTDVDPNDLERIFEAKINIGMNEWPLPPYY